MKLLFTFLLLKKISKEATFWYLLKSSVSQPHTVTGREPSRRPPPRTPRLQDALLTRRPLRGAAHAGGCRSSRPISRKAPRILAHALLRCRLALNFLPFPLTANTMM